MMNSPNSKPAQESKCMATKAKPADVQSQAFGKLPLDQKIKNDKLCSTKTSDSGRNFHVRLLDNAMDTKQSRRGKREAVFVRSTQYFPSHFFVNKKRLETIFEMAEEQNDAPPDKIYDDNKLNAKDKKTENKGNNYKKSIELCLSAAASCLSPLGRNKKKLSTKIRCEMEQNGRKDSLQKFSQQKYHCKPEKQELSINSERKAASAASISLTKNTTAQKEMKSATPSKTEEKVASSIPVDSVWKTGALQASWTRSKNSHSKSVRNHLLEEEACCSSSGFHTTPDSQINSGKSNKKKRKTVPIQLDLFAAGTSNNSADSKDKGDKSSNIRTEQTNTPWVKVASRSLAPTTGCTKAASNAACSNAACSNAVCSSEAYSSANTSWPVPKSKIDYRLTLGESCSVPKLDSANSFWAHKPSRADDPKVVHTKSNSDMEPQTDGVGDKDTNAAQIPVCDIWINMAVRRFSMEGMPPAPEEEKPKEPKPTVSSDDVKSTKNDSDDDSGWQVATKKRHKKNGNYHH